MSTPRIATIPTSKPGRPQAVRRKVEELIGTAGYIALMEADLFVVPGAMVRDLALVLGEPVPPMPLTKNASRPKPAPDTKPEPIPESISHRQRNYGAQPTPEVATDIVGLASALKATMPEPGDAT